MNIIFNLFILYNLTFLNLWLFNLYNKLTLRLIIFYLYILFLRLVLIWVFFWIFWETAKYLVKIFNTSHSDWRSILSCTYLTCSSNLTKTLINTKISAVRYLMYTASNFIWCIVIILFLRILLSWSKPLFYFFIAVIQTKRTWTSNILLPKILWVQNLTLSWNPWSVW